jgi:23S rRNA (uracil-5-)-methyltransferase RumA
VFNRGEIVALDIQEYSFGGRGVAKIPTEQGNFIVFVDNAFPGQKVKVKIDVKRKRHAEAKLIEVLERSPLEINQPFQEISGGPYIFVPIQTQQHYKKQSTLEVFSRLAGIKHVEDIFDDFISSPEVFYYRNKMEYSFSCIGHDFATGEDVDNDFALGFKRRGTWWKVESLDKPSGMFDEEWETKLVEVRAFLKATNLPAWHPPKKEGFFRHIVVRKSFYQDQLLINLVTSSTDLKHFDAKAFSDFLVNLLGNRLAGFQHTINDNVADRSKIENGKCTLLYGQPIVIEKLHGLEFEISMESFFQTNPKSAELLYNKALDYVFEEEISSDKVIMDMFCGTGTIGQLLAKRNSAVKIVGVDIVEEAIEDAKRNAKRNAISGIDFYAADVGKFLKQHPDFIDKIQTIVLDPPRAGIAPKTLNKLIELNATHIVYISCNPSTQARDAVTLFQAGYQMEKLSFVDQFPHTGHIESVAKFKKV